ncbi:hypothetical protein [Rugamonas sp.]|uniref:hypothetical protein n=1 Tax=Rugamonas sp. TaxID=1926287 RepID=UPI0025E42CFF|nr:hypothetical protein [Rugamonas sp.]
MEKLKSSLIYASYLEQLSVQKTLNRVHDIVTAVENNVHCFERMAALPNHSGDWEKAKQEAINFLIIANRVKKMFEIEE